jgi:riboflavin synthase
MFTGIIEKTLRVIAVSDGPGFRRLVLANPWGDVELGESIAVNGCCLTVSELSDGEMSFDVVKETLSRTNLGQLAGGEEAHVERSLRLGDRVSGHFVQGHVDGTGLLLDQKAGPNEWRLVIEAPDALAKYLTPKGSITVDGVSLTLASVAGNRFEVALIPTTVQLTALLRRPIGWPFNLEADILVKTVVNQMER